MLIYFADNLEIIDNFMNMFIIYINSILAVIYVNKQVLDSCLTYVNNSKYILS
jgi:hypothetical protein